MRTFTEMENKYRDIHVRYPGNDEVSGIIRVDGADTRVTLNSDDHLSFTTDENGCFDLRLEGVNGDSIFLHNALKTSSTRYGSGRCETHIFPNIIIFARQSEFEKVKSVSFMLMGLNNFFLYQNIEGHFLHDTPEETKKFLKDLRRERLHRANITEDEGFFRPMEIYAVHRIPRIMKFRVDDRFYEIGTFGWWQGGHLGHLEVRHEPVATIIFETPAGLDEALQHVWEWQQFFVQIGMEQMPLKAMAARTERSIYSAEAEIYFPAIARQLSEKAPLRLHPSEVPFNRWPDKRNLSELMQRWLAKSEQRRRFRGLLNRAIEDLEKRLQINDIVKLCAAIDSLSELEEPGGIDTCDVKKMARAASAVINETEPVVDEERIRNALNTIRFSSLAKKIDRLGERLKFSVNREDCIFLRKEAVRLRNRAAHGHSDYSPRIPVIASVVEALASMCVLFDLSTAEVLPQSEDWHKVKALSNFHHGMDELRK